MIRRIQREYEEMPGLRLTENQARRLWGPIATRADSLWQRFFSAGF